MAGQPSIDGEQQLAAINRLLSDEPECRFLTLIGPEGTGKAQLALQAAAQVGHAFPDGVHLVSLASPLSARLLLSAIADALRISVQEQSELRTQLFGELRDKKLLLVLIELGDSVEDAALNVLSDLFRMAPGISVLATSRVKLDLNAQWAWMVEKLCCPAGSPSVDGELARGWADAPDRVEGAADQGTIGLFLEHVYRVYPDFALSDADRAAAAQICQLVEGAPLGLELASASARLIPLPEMAQGIQRQVDHLAATLRDLPPRQRALQAVFEHSWQLLSQAEQAAVAKLSVFRGGFDGKAAGQVADASPFLLAALVDHYLLRSDSSGRYDMHELLRQFAADKLHQISATGGALSATGDPLSAAEREARDSHCSYYSSLLARQQGRLRGAERHDAADEIAADIDNVRAAWRWAVDGLKLPEIEQSLESLYLFYYARGWVQEGESAFTRALAGLEAGEGAGEGRGERVAGRLLARLARFSWRLGRHQEAREQLHRSLAICERLEVADAAAVSAEKAFGLFSLSVVLRGDGEYERARRLCQESLALYRQADDHLGMAMARKQLGIVAGAMGSLGEAERQLSEALALYQESGDPYGTANTLNDLGIVAAGMDQYTCAKRFQQECLSIRRQIEDLWGVGTSLNNLGYLAYLAQEYTEAKAYLSESLAIQRQIGDRYHIANCLCNLGAAAAALGERQEALDHLYQALGIAYEIEVPPLILEALGEIGALLAVGEAGQKERAVELLNLVRRHTQADNWTANRAEHSLAQLAPSLEPEGWDSPPDKDEVGRWEDVVPALLKQRAGRRTEQADMPGSV